MSNSIEKKMVPDSDLELVDKFQKGEQQAFNQLVLRYQKKIHDLVYRMIRNNQDALDLAQEVFVKAYHNLNGFKKESTFYTWLYRIAMNLSINHSRQKKLRQLVSFFELGDTLPAESNPAQELEQNQISSAIDQAILTLPKKQRSVFVLRYYDQMPYKEISDLLGKTEGSLKASYFQALKKLQKKLKPYR